MSHELENTFLSTCKTEMLEAPGPGLRITTLDISGFRLGKFTKQRNRIAPLF